ncbi:MAG TPA: 5-(carboxyamino)imidazole ribonucleotide synthase [Burkholderiaceae bacterium]|nr:5-(carboxyamino)imidazole ribonucleotide synthase [Burkholderiaceae bacterium]
MNLPILPGATLGVLGGGQLGRMFVHAAQSLGYATAVLDPDGDSPAGRVSEHHVSTGYLDPTGLERLAELTAAVSTEFENVPADALAGLARTRVVSPSADAVSVCQDRSAEKAQFVRCGVPCASHASIVGPSDLDAVPDHLLPGILKTARMGYDGKGQCRVTTRVELVQAWTALQRVPCVLEKLLPLKGELSVIVARGADGRQVHLPIQQNLHRDGILAVTEAPAPDVSATLQQEAVACAGRIAEALAYVGVLCVEFFVVDDGSPDGALMANEMAPRPHNSGHHSIDSCDVSQFELQVRTLTGLPLVVPRQHSCALMLNLLGNLWFDADGRERCPPWDRVLALPGVHLHLYGKTGPRPGRKMGHVTITASSVGETRRTGRAVAELLGIEAI